MSEHVIQLLGNYLDIRFCLPFFPFGFRYLDEMYDTMMFVTGRILEPYDGTAGPARLLEIPGVIASAFRLFRAPSINNC